jgi:hypothetical protein
LGLKKYVQDQELLIFGDFFENLAHCVLWTKKNFLVKFQLGWVVTGMNLKIKNFHVWSIFKPKFNRMERTWVVTYSLFNRVVTQMGCSCIQSEIAPTWLKSTTLQIVQK